MSPNQNAAEDAVLRVSRELYARLREHCDRLGIRFVDFVEDALDNAVMEDVENNSLEKELEALRRKAESYDRAFNRGFQQGFAFFHLMLKGLGVSESLDEELTIVRKFPAVVPKGEQVKLF